MVDTSRRLPTISRTAVRSTCTYISWIERIEAISHARKGKSKKIQTTNLVVDLVEEDVRIRYLHLLLNPPVGGEVRDVGTTGQAGTADEQPDNPALRVDHYGARVAAIRKGAVLVAVRVDGDLEGPMPDVVAGVVANERLHTAEATKSGACGISVLDDNQTLLAVGIELLRLADLVMLHDPFDLEEPARGVLEVGPALRVGVHLLYKVVPRNLAWIYIYNTGDGVAKIRWKRTDINLVALESVPVDLFAVEIDQGPVLDEVNGAVAVGNGRDVDGGNGRGADDVTDNTLV